MKYYIISLKRILRHYCPVYINTLNIFKPFRTLMKNIKQVYHIGIPHISLKFYNRSYRWLEENFYTWYFWDHPTIWNFKSKILLIIIDDVMYKTTFGLHEFQQSPFILIRFFNYNFIFQIKSPKGIDNYRFWENLKYKYIS